MLPLVNRDPSAQPPPAHARWMVALVNDPRDWVFVDLIIKCALVAAFGISLFWSGRNLLWLAPMYWAFNGLWAMDRFILMLHCTSHRALFKKRYSVLNLVIPWVLGPFFGETPEAYFAHHLGMHHREENGPEDLSTTIFYRRDSFRHWLRYFLRFMLWGHFELLSYLRKRHNQRLLRRLMVGEYSYFAAVVFLFWVAPGPTFVVFIGPLLVVRAVMMAGNWGQHAFVCQEQPGSSYRNSITCINTRYNRRCFNDGYHIGHHLVARSHWSEHPAWFERSRAEYGAEDAIVFHGVDFFEVWLALMLGRWHRLAKAFVPLPGAPERDHEQIIAFLRSRVQPLPPSVSA